MRGLFGKSAALAAVSACLLLTCGTVAAAPVYAPGYYPAYPQQPGMSGAPAVVGVQAFGGVAMAAYQQPYAMNFEIWQPEGLPAGWYATFDGFPVAQVAPNRWVYGQPGGDGALVPTNILVGSIVPSEVPGLVRVGGTWLYHRYINDPAFHKIMDHYCDHMGFMNDPLVRTAIAWRSGTPGVWVWLGDRWKKILPRSGEYTWQALRRYREWIAEELRRNRIWWFGSELWDLADLARQWGLLWSGGMRLDGLNAYRGDSDNDRSGGSVERVSTPDTPSMPEAPAEEPGGGQWDVD